MLEDVITGHDAAETIKQLVSIAPDGRSLRHDDRVDALAWAIASLSHMLLADEADTLESGYVLDMERLLELPLRKGGITEDGPEMRSMEFNEDEDRLVMRLEHALSVQADELRHGKVDENYQRYIEKLQADVRSIRRYTSPAQAATA